MKKDKPIFTIKLLVLFLISTILIRTMEMLFQIEISDHLVLYPSNLSQPLNWYRFLTYPLESVGLFGWIRTALIILPAGFIIEKRTARKNLITITLISVVLGGLVFTITNQVDELNRAMASPGLIAWGYWIAAITCGVMHWKDLKMIEKAVVVMFLLSALNFGYSNFGYLIAQLGVVTAVLIFVLTFKVFKRKAVANNVFMPAG